MDDDEYHYATSFGLRKIEILLVGILAIVYFYLRYNHGDPLLVAGLGFVLALWAIMKPTEWAVEGLTLFAYRAGIGTYAAGVLGSLMANLPELVLASILILKGQTGLGILTVLMVAGANTLLFGVVTVRNTLRAGGTVKVPVTTLKYESELMLVAFMTSIFLLVFNLAESIEGRLVTSADGLPSLKIPVLFSIGTVLIYCAYLGFLINDDSLNPDISDDDRIKIKKEPALGWKNIGKFLFFGTLGVLIAGELLANGAEILIHQSEQSGVKLNEAQIALIVGFLGSLPEWAIAFRADDIELVFGSVLSSISATLLFMIGLVSIILFVAKKDFILDPYGLVQIVLSGGVLLFVNTIMKDDEKLDTFEGLCIVILQLVGFEVLLSV